MLKMFSNQFFHSMRLLNVLDLSGNRGLVELPKSISELFNLQYLNLSETAIMGLPSGLKRLRRLKCLLLDYTKNLTEIPREVISSLLHLQVFSIVADECSPSHSTALYDEEGLLVEMERLEELGDLRITIRSASGAKRISVSQVTTAYEKTLTQHLLFFEHSQSIIFFSDKNEASSEARNNVL